MKTNISIARDVIRAGLLLLSAGFMVNAQAIPTQQINILCTATEPCGQSTGTTLDGTIFEAEANPTTPSTGTGVFRPFVTIQETGNADGFQDGYNTDAGERIINGDTKSRWTDAVLFSDLGTVEIDGLSYFQFSLDANEKGKADSDENQIDILDIQLFRGGDELIIPEINGGYVDGAPPTLAGNDAFWTLDNATNGDVTVTLQSSICDTNGQCGSGKGDLNLFILESLFDDFDGDWFGFYTEYGRASSGFEEWRYLAGSTDVPEPGMVGLLAIGLLGMVVARRRLKA